LSDYDVKRFIGQWLIGSVMALQSWEDPLLALAYEAFSSPARSDTVKSDNHALENAYRYCGNVTKGNSRTFYLAAALLPKAKRRAAHALYAFCRSTDDLIDKVHVPENRGDNLADWRKRLTSSTPTAYDPVPLAWADAQANFDIPRGYASQLLDGIARDLTHNRYPSFTELTEYCYSVASRVWADAGGRRCRTGR
jgi:15-cis-phytoene synthase